MENRLSLTRRKALGLAAASLTAPCFASSASAADAPVLVELFTSQGCSSCPPADKLAGTLMGQPGVTVVSLNVDYWDYLGWHDTLAKPEYTQRQMAYAKSRGDNDVYTPQMVINGAAHVVGSNRDAVESAISAERRSAPAVALQIRATDNDIIIDVPKGDSASDATLWVMSIAPAVNVKIERGENSGKSITYHNVVRKLASVGSWNGSASTIKLPRKGIISGDCKSCIAVLQKGHVGPVLGLAKWSAVGA
jgi:hypothetical protein